MKRIFLISYFYKPNKSVGILRMAYWFDLLSEMGYDVTLITAEDGPEENQVIRIVMPNSTMGVFLKDKSYIWGQKVYQYFKKNILVRDTDTVIMTGGPFLQFLPLIKLKIQNPSLNFITDYRDPLTNNPRIKSFFLKKIIKRYIEGKTNTHSDSIIAVNKICQRLLIRAKNSIVIDNGYDERIYRNVDMSCKKNNILVYAGKFYDEIYTENFIYSIINSQNNLFFYYLGNSKIPIESSKVYNLGMRDYSVAANYLKESSIGIVLTGGSPFQSTTKIFDYIGAKLKILIITQGIIETGIINEIIRDNPNVEWSTNDIVSITKAIDKLYARDYIEWDHTRYCRLTGLKLLVAIL